MMWLPLVVSLVTAQTVAPTSPEQTITAAELPKPPPDRLTWRSGTPRPFVAALADAGYLYLRPRLSLGYGMPHFRWAGIDINPIFSGQGVGGWAGLRLAIPYIDIRAGARAFYSFQRSFLEERDSYNRWELELSGGKHADYLTWETEISSGLSGRYGELSLMASLSAVTGVPKGQFVFEETLRVVVDPSLVWRARAAYGLFPIASYRQFSLGPAVDVLGIPNRDEVLVRAGIVARIVFNRALEVRGSFVPTIVSRDRLGLITSDFTELGVRYRWASN